MHINNCDVVLSCFNCTAIKRNKGGKLWKEWREGAKERIQGEGRNILNVTLVLLSVVKDLGFLQSSKATAHIMQYVVSLIKIWSKVPSYNNLFLRGYNFSLLVQFGDLLCSYHPELASVKICFENHCCDSCSINIGRFNGQRFHH